MLIASPRLNMQVKSTRKWLTQYNITMKTHKLLMLMKKCGRPTTGVCGFLHINEVRINVVWLLSNFFHWSCFHIHTKGFIINALTHCRVVWITKCYCCCCCHYSRVIVATSDPAIVVTVTTVFLPVCKGVVLHFFYRYQVKRLSVPSLI